ncbi:MAG TPA: SRPBCC family protein [Caulobacteraceae bacterium]|nr:SRPBCC family protein [Caulobacteraceae bacterium]
MRHRLTRVLPYAPEQLFQLVGEVERYPEFVPWITRMRLFNPREVAPGVDELDAEASVSFAFLTERFSTRVRRDAPAAEIGVGLIRGPFRKLKNRWRFTPQGAGTLVEFEIDFEFSSRLLDALLRANVGYAMNRLIGCFEERARALYGSST